MAEKRPPLDLKKASFNLPEAELLQLKARAAAEKTTVTALLIKAMRLEQAIHQSGEEGFDRILLRGRGLDRERELVVK